MVQPDKEAVITQAEHRMMAVQRDADERWKNRTANEDKITNNTIHSATIFLRYFSSVLKFFLFLFEKEGKEERKEGRKQGSKEGRKEGRNEGREERRKKGRIESLLG